VSSIRVDPSKLTLRLTKEQLPSAAHNLDRFVKVNDALIAHCRCAGRTNVELQDSQLPAYLVRLDPATRQSEILVLVQR